VAEPIPAQRAPYGVNIEAGKDYWWCACGRSAKQPFCDGSHKAVGLAPLKFSATETKQAWLCGCKSGSNKPLRRLSQEHLMLNTRKGCCLNLGGALAIFRAKPLRSGAALPVFAQDGACNSRRK
jgi:CDGSH iron-sulfur domain-containing protein 3